MAFKIKIYDYSLDGCDYCIGSDRLNLVELNWQLEMAQGDDVDVHISSVGGSAFEAIGMYDALKKYPGKVTTFIDSLAASAASIIAMAGNEVVMSKFALLMIHKPIVGSGGNADQMQADINMLNIVQSRLAGIYMDKTGMDEETINELINATSWFTADQALSLGFIDRIEDYESEVSVTNHTKLKVYAQAAPAVCQRVFNKLKVTNTNTETMKVEDQKLIDQAKALITKVTNWFKSAPNKTVTNKGTINSLVPLAVGVAVTNEAGEDLEDGEYEAENSVKATVTNGIVTAMEEKKPDNAAEEAEKSEEEKEDVKNEAVLNSVGLKVTNKAEVAGIAKVISNQQKELSESASLIVDLNKQIKVLNTAVDRDEAAIRETIKSEFEPTGSKRSDKSVTNKIDQMPDSFKPKSDTANNYVKRAVSNSK